MSTAEIRQGIHEEAECGGGKGRQSREVQGFLGEPDKILLGGVGHEAEPEDVGELSLNRRRSGVCRPVQQGTNECGQNQTDRPGALIRMR